MLASRDTGSDAGSIIAALSNATGNNWGLWAEGYGSLGERRGNDASSRYDYDMAGFAIADGDIPHAEQLPGE